MDKYLIVGLGNIGSSYIKTSKNFLHNLPFNKTSKSSRNFKNTSFKKIKSKTQAIYFQSYSDLITFYSEDVNKLNELINKFNRIGNRLLVFYFLFF